MKLDLKWTITGVCAACFVIAAVILVMGLTACSMTTAVKVGCLSMASYSKAQEAAIGAELRTLPQADPVRLAMGDYTRLRAANAACAGAAP